MPYTTINTLYIFTLGTIITFGKFMYIDKGVITSVYSFN